MKDPELPNTLIYTTLTTESPTRHQMIKYSTWRIYLYNELEGVSVDRRDTKRTMDPYQKQFPQIAISEDRRRFYDFVYKPIEGNDNLGRWDNISHFVCRMLYCLEEGTHQTFVEIEKRILQSRLRRYIPKNQPSERQILMQLLKKLLTILKSPQPTQSPQSLPLQSSYNIPIQQWQTLRQQITFNCFSKRQNQYPRLYAKLPFADAEAGIRKRRSFIRGGFVYCNLEVMIDVVLGNYDIFLRRKLEKARPVVQDLIVDDVENQFSAFLISTIKQINEEGMEETKFNGKFNLTLRNIDGLNKYFPPCMLNLNQHLKISRHLRHDGRRQLWGFFKACGMDVHENKQYFRKHLEGKVTASQMKTHMYNIEHAYGMQGKRKAQGPWKCRNIITGTAPKKGQHHGCPFYHWRTEQLSDFLRKNYRVSQQNLKQIIKQKDQKHFQVACGRLFQYSDHNVNSESMSMSASNVIPPEITAKLGRAPYLYYEAGMELRERRLKKDQMGGNQDREKDKMRDQRKLIQF